MRGQFVAIMAVSLLSTMALAQSNTQPQNPKQSTKSNAKQSAKLAKKNKRTNGTVSPTTQPAEGTPGTAANTGTTTLTSPTATATSGTGTSTASAPTVTPPSTRKLRGELQTVNYFPKEGAPTSVNYVGLNYKVGGTKTLGVRQQFGYTYPKEDADGKANLADTYINFTESKLFSFAGDGNVVGNVRVYLPTGDKSRDFMESYGNLWLRAITSKAFGKFSVSTDHTVRFFAQSKDSYLDAKGTEKANSDFDTYHYAEAAYNFNDNVSLGYTAGIEEYWKRPTSKTGTTRSSLLSLFGALTFAVTKDVTVQTGILNEIEVHSPDGLEFRPYRAEQTQGVLVINASI